MARKISVEIVGDARSLEKAFAKSSRSARNFQGDMQKTSSRGRRMFGGLTKSIGLVAGGIGAAGLVGAAHAAFAELQNAQQVSAQTTAALKSTGKAAHVTAKHVDELADAMLQKSGIDDEATKTAENMLLTFTKVRNEVGKGNRVFDQATNAVADMATRMNGGAIPSAEQMQQAALRLGKALNDPVKGVGALSRVGVQFTAQQKQQIKTLVATGHVLEAQKVILGELRTEFGGSAQAAGQTLAGQLSKLRNVALNLGASIAQILTPSIEKVVNQLVRWLSNSRNQKTVLDTVRAAAAAVTSAVRVLSAAFQVLSKIVGGNVNAIKLLFAAFVAFKALKMIGYVATLAKTFKSLAAAETAAAGAGAAGAGGKGMGRFGKALGAVGAVAVGAPLVASAVRKIPGWDRTFKGLGGAVAGMTVARQENHFYGVQNPREMERELTKRAKGRPHRRRGN